MSAAAERNLGREAAETAEKARTAAGQPARPAAGGEGAGFRKPGVRQDTRDVEPNRTGPGFRPGGTRCTLSRVWLVSM